MITHGRVLLEQRPIVDMLHEKVSHQGVSHGLSELGYDIRIKQDISFYPRRDEGGMPDELNNDGKYYPGRFALASTIEEFNMPNDLGAIVHDKSTWARRGLSVFNTVIEPGWKGFLTLELVYHGHENLHIPAGSGIAQVIFHQIAVPAAYTGKYQNQEDRPVEAIFPK
jgi:dCTP deaminase